MALFDIIDASLVYLQKIKDLGADRKNSIEITLSPIDFNKLDEELYYRQNPQGKDFIPSDDYIELKIDNAVIHFLKNGASTISNNTTEKQ